jgi:ubiquinone/menaquinone biosynthesis C-methylase UbiE
MDYKGRLRKGFGPMAGKYDRFVSRLSLGRIRKWQSEMLSAMPVQDSLLDLGTGTGEIPYLAVQKGVGNVIGLDLVFEMLSVAKEKFPFLRLINGDVKYLPVRKESVDTLTLSFCFRYLTSPQSFLDEARRVLRNDGKIGILDICSVGKGSLVVRIIRPLLPAISYFLKFFTTREEHPLEVLQKRYTVDEIKGLLEKNGFSLTYEKTHFLGKVAIVCAVLKE